MAGAIVPAAQTAAQLLNVASLARSLGLDQYSRRAVDYLTDQVQQTRAKRTALRKAIEAHKASHATTTKSTVGKGSYNRSMPYRRSYKKPAYKRKAKKIRKADKMIKRAKKRRNYKVLSRIPRPIGGLEERKCVRLIATENSFFHWGPPPSGGTTITNGMIIGGGGGYPQAPGPVTHAPQYKTFCLNDLGTPFDTTVNRGGGWRPHIFWDAEGGSITEQPATMGHVPGWRTWAGFYEKAEIIGAKVKVRFTNTTRDAAIQSPALVGYNMQHDRTENGDAWTVHQQLNNFGEPNNPEASRQIHTAEDLERAKIFSTRVVKPEAPGDVANFKINYSTRKSFPNVSSSSFSTSQATTTAVSGNPGPIKNKSYLTLCACPVLNAAGVQHYSIGYSIEIEFLVLYSEMQNTYKTTAQVLSGNFKAQVVPS